MGFYISPGFVTIPDVDSIVALCIHIFHLSDCSLSCCALCAAPPFAAFFPALDLWCRIFNSSRLLSKLFFFAAAQMYWNDDEWARRRLQTKIVWLIINEKFRNSYMMKGWRSRNNGENFFWRHRPASYCNITIWSFPSHLCSAKSHSIFPLERLMRINTNRGLRVLVPSTSSA